MVARHRMALAALLAQSHPQPAVLRKDILDRHAKRRADPTGDCRDVREPGWLGLAGHHSHGGAVGRGRDTDQDTGRVATILGYPTDKLTQAV
jgi:hypothetical protein